MKNKSCIALTVLESYELYVYLGIGDAIENSTLQRIRRKLE